MVSLNAGCGNDFWGDVRMDVDPQAKARTHLMDICGMNFPDGSFEETKCISVLEHIPDWKRAIYELCRVTSGWLIIEVPVNSNLLLTDLFRILIPTPGNIRLWKNRKERAAETFHQFNPEEICQEIKQHGFKVRWKKVFQIYHSYPSRCYRFRCFRIQKGQ